MSLLVLSLLACNDNGVTVHHEPPSVAIFEPADGTQFYEEQLIEFRAEVATLDGSSVEDLTHRWTAGSTTLCEESYVPAEGIATCVGDFSSAGEYQVTVTVTDPRLDRATDTVTVNVRYNNPPEITLSAPAEGAVLPPDESVVLRAFMADAEDEADELLVSLKSSIDGEIALAETSPATSGDYATQVELSDGAHLLTLTVTDTAGKTGQASVSVKKGNGAPRIDTVSIDPNPLLSIDTATCVPSGWTDEDGDPERYTYQWFLDEVEATTETTNKFPYGKTSKGDALRCTATPYDDYNVGSTVSSSTVIVENSPPTTPSIIIDPSPAQPEDDLTCTVTTHSTDEDGDTITYAFSWTRNGTATSHTSAVVGSGDTAHGDTWACTVTPNDGEENGTAATATVTVEDTEAPSAPVISGIDEFRNDEDVELTGACEANCDLTWYLSDSTGSWTEKSTCSSTGGIAHTTYVTRGYETDIYVTCTDAAANVSSNSNTVTTQACDPEDTYENSAGYGDTSGNPIDEWAVLADDGSTTITIEGNILNSTDEDWYIVSTSDDYATDLSYGYNNYDVAIDLTEGSSDYSFLVYVDGYTAGGGECSGDYPSGTTSFNYFQEDVGDGSHAIPSNTAACATGSASYNECSDFTQDMVIEVIRDTGSTPSCQAYELTITNGL